MTAKPLAALALTAALLLCGIAQAQTPLKIAVVDLQYALNESQEGKRAIAQIEGFVKAKQLDIAKTEDSVKAKSTWLEENRAMLDPAVVAEKERELASLYLEYQQGAYEAQAEMSEMEMQLRGKILEKLATSAAKLAEAKAFDLVIEAGSMVFFKETTDLTSELITNFNAGK